MAVVDIFPRRPHCGKQSRQFRVIRRRQQQREVRSVERREQIEARVGKEAHRRLVDNAVGGEAASEERIKRCGARPVQRNEDRDAPHRIAIENERPVCALRMGQEFGCGIGASSDDNVGVRGRGLTADMTSEVVI